MNANIFAHTIEMTNTEAKAAGKINSPAYTELMILKKSFPDFQISIVKPAAKKAVRFKGLDYNYMEGYIKTHDATLLETFYELRGLDKDGKRNGVTAAVSYGEIKMWFLTQFSEIEEMSENVNKIIDKARKQRAEKRAALAA